MNSSQRKHMDTITGMINVPPQLVQIMELVKQNKAETVMRTTNGITTVDIKLPRRKEDSLYEDHYIRHLVPRGLCFIFINNTYVHSVQGHPKFGNYGDYMKSKDDAKCVQKVFRRKENGECGHFSGFTHDNIRYVVFGSKNVHLVLRLDHMLEDLKSFNETRYMFAQKIAQLMISKYGNSIDAMQKMCSDNGYTFDFEACFLDSQHLVKYDSDTLFFFAITGVRQLESSSLTAVSPLDADIIFRSFNVPTVTVTHVGTTAEEIKSIEQKVENDDNSEGAVVSCIDESGKVTYVYKHKNYTYIFRRAVREQMRKRASMRGILRRLSVLHIQHPNAEQLTQQMLQFNAYFRLLPYDEQQNFFSNWVTHEEKFNAMSDETKQGFLTQYTEEVKKNGTLTVYMIVAMPGSGKSYLARALKQLFTKYMKADEIVHLEQDMFVQSHGRNAAKAYDDAIKRAIGDPQVQMLILAKSNHSEEVRNKTYDLLDKSPKEIERVYITITCNDDTELEQQLMTSRNICVQRIMARGNAHTSMVNLNEAQVANILDSVFVKQWAPLTEEEEKYPIVSLDIAADREHNLKSCIAQLYENGIIDNYEFTSDDLNAAHITVQADDARILKHNIDHPPKAQAAQKKVLYDELIVNGEHVIQNLDLNGLKKKDELHITIKYYGNKTEPQHDFPDGIPFDISITGYAIDEKACALLCDLSMYPELTKHDENRCYHITYALSDGTKPVYSSELLTKAIDNGTIKLFAEPITIQCLSKRVTQN